MSIVMFYSGYRLPEYLEDCFRQICKFNPAMDIYFLTDNEHLSDPIFSRYEVEVVDKDDYYSDEISRLKVLYGRGENDFWTIAIARLFYIANFLNKEELYNVYHFENDVLIYEDLSKHHSMFQKLYKNLAITVGGPDKCMTGFMFIKSGEALKEMTNYFIWLLGQYNKFDLKNLYKMDMVNEMTLMRVYNKELPDKLVSLPILPFGEWSNNFDSFHSIFDPASWGQFVGGTADGVPGAKPDDHYIGKLLQQHPEYSVVWEKDDKDRRVPYFVYDGQEVKINNLHIHSKNLHLYMS